MINGLHSAADALVVLHGWRRWLSAFVAGCASVLALPPVFFAPVLFITLPVLVLLLDGADADPPRAKGWHLGPFFLTGWWFGFGYFLAGLFWLAEALLVNAAAHAWMIPFALVLIPGGLAVFVALATSLAGFVWGTGFARIGILAVCLTVFEALRGVVFTGFPWNGFHSALGAHDVLLQGFALVGPLGATLLVLLVAMVPAAFWPTLSAGLGVGRGSKVAVSFVLAALLGWASYGALRLSVADDGVVDGITMRIVQPNIAQADKWDPALRETNFATLLSLTTDQQSPDDFGLLGASHVVWPESAFPFLLTARPDALAAISQALPLGSSMLAGAIRAEPRSDGGGETRVFTNAVYALNDRGEIADAYDKVRLVPFGEQLPFADLLDRLGIRALVSAPTGFVPGRGPDVLSTTSGPDALALVCYEAIFPGFVRQGVREHSPGYLLNVTNDAWFGTSAGPHQHFFQARLRSVETGIPLVRAANTGISAVVDGYGRTQGSLALGARGVLRQALPVALTQTLYLRFGDMLLLTILVMVLSISLYHQRKQKPV